MAAAKELSELTKMCAEAEKRPTMDGCLLDKARRVLRELQCLEDVKSAIAQNELGPLEEAIKKAKVPLAITM